MKRVWIVSVGFALIVTLAAGAETIFRWEKVPAKDHARTNPLAGNVEAIKSGAALYKDHCAQCHGADATGTGPKKPSLRSEEVRNATDGDLEWFLRQGELRHGMPSWSSLPQTQRWELVAFLRSLARHD